jgi:hypothetical protein
MPGPPEFGVGVDESAQAGCVGAERRRRVLLQDPSRQSAEPEFTASPGLGGAPGHRPGRPGTGQEGSGEVSSGRLFRRHGKRRGAPTRLVKRDPICAVAQGWSRAVLRYERRSPGVAPERQGSRLQLRCRLGTPRRAPIIGAAPRGVKVGSGPCRQKQRLLITKRGLGTHSAKLCFARACRKHARNGVSQAGVPKPSLGTSGGKPSRAGQSAFLDRTAKACYSFHILFFARERLSRLPAAAPRRARRPRDRIPVLTRPMPHNPVPDRPAASACASGCRRAPSRRWTSCRHAHA